MRKLLSLLLLLPFVATSQTITTTSIGSGNSGANLVVGRPAGWTSTEKLPLVFWMPGQGEMTSDVNRMFIWGPFATDNGTSTGTPRWNHTFVSDAGQRFILIGLQRNYCYNFSSNESASPGIIAGLLNTIVANYNIDTAKIFASGYSCGGWNVNGFVSWSLTNAHWIRRMFTTAAQAPANAAGTAFFNWRPEYVREAGIDYWNVIGSADNTTTTPGPVGFLAWARNVNTTLQGYGMSNRYTELAGQGHSGSWLHDVYNPNWSGGSYNQDMYSYLVDGPASANQAPVVSAGPDQNLPAGTTSTTLTGTATDPDGTIVSRFWGRTSGPQATITNQGSASTTVTDLTPGTFLFRFVATDNAGVQSADTLQVTVNAVTCVAQAGADQVITAGTNVVDLNGSGSINATGYAWRRITSVATESTGQVKNGREAIAKAILFPIGTYQYELTVTGSSCNSRDTMNVTVNPVSYPPQSPGAGWRVMTAGDLDSMPQARAGDIFIAGANAMMVNGQYTASSINGSSMNLTPGKRIYMNSGRYQAMNISFTGATNTATFANPVILTNINGQVEIMGSTITNAKNMRITGRYVPGVSGHPEYLGHADNAYAWSRGSYGLFFNRAWTSVDGQGLYLTGSLTDSVEVEFVEVGNGNFANVMIKSDGSMTDPFDGLWLHDIYNHDSHSEAWYLLSTGAGHAAHGWIIENNRSINGGGESIQFMKQSGKNIIRNNAIIKSGVNYKSPFGQYQDGGSQQSYGNSGNQFVNNLLLGGGFTPLNLTTQATAGETQTSDSNLVARNLVDGSFGILGFGYASTSLPGGKTVIRDNWVGGSDFMGSIVYSDSRGTNSNIHLATAGSAPVYVTGNQYDNSKTTFTSGGNITQSGNSQAALIKPVFINSGWPTSQNWNRIQMWADSIHWTWQHVTTDTVGVKFKQPVIYAAGDTVICFSKYYVSKVNGNHAHIPSGGSDAWWTQIFWNGYSYPPEDYRLQVGSFYQTRGLGLQYTITPEDPGQILRFRSARKLKFIN